MSVGMVLHSHAVVGFFHIRVAGVGLNTQCLVSLLQCGEIRIGLLRLVRWFFVGEVRLYVAEAFKEKLKEIDDSSQLQSEKSTQGT